MPPASALGASLLGILFAVDLLTAVDFAVAWGMWVAVPIGLELADLDRRWQRRLLMVWPPSALVGTLSFLGEMSGVWAWGGGATYLAFCAWVALAGLAALRATGRAGERGSRAPAQACAALGLVLLPVAGAWHLAERMGWTVLGFSGLWAGLTAAHFHFAGFATPILLGRGMRRARSQERERQAWGEVALLALGVPSVALGITFSPGLALFGTVCMVIPIWSCCLRALRCREGSPLVRVLRSSSAVVPVFSMSLALAWSLSVVLRVNWLDLNQMIRYHGLVNALGFISLGFAAERLELARSRRNPAPDA